MPETLPKTPPTSLGSWALLIAGAIDSYQLNSTEIFAQAGIDINDLRKDNARIPAFKLYDIWYQAVEQSNDPYFGLRVAHLYQTNAFSALGMALAASRTVYEAILRCARYGHIISDATEATVEETDNEIIFTINSRKGMEKLANIYSMSAIVCVMIKILNSMSNQPQKLKGVYFEGEISQGSQPFEDYFNCPVYFSAPHNKVILDKDATQEEMPYANLKLASSLDEWIDENLSQFQEDQLSNRVQKYLLKNLTYGEVSLNNVAKGLAMSARVMQRRLKEEGSVYSDLLDACRHKIAIKLITEQKQPIFEVALALGFSDQSNFTRAFKRWTGTTPYQYRG